MTPVTWVEREVSTTSGSIQVLHFFWMPQTLSSSVSPWTERAVAAASYTERTAAAPANTEKTTPAATWVERAVP